jgi:hypothetical protein
MAIKYRKIVISSKTITVSINIFFFYKAKSMIKANKLPLKIVFMIKLNT